MSSLHEEEHDEAHEEPWLVSYADLMTLLFGFFVLMYSFAKQGDEQFEKVRKDLAVHFGGEYVTDEFKKLANEFKKALGESPLIDDIIIKVTPDSMEITFKSTVLFASGNADLLPQARDPMKILVDMITKKGNDFRISVEGHTDDLPIASKQYPSNWELSGARASTVIRLFEKKGYKKDLLHATAFADSRPAFPNRDKNGQSIPSNQAKNRRVLIRVLRLKDKRQPASAEASAENPKASSEDKI